MTGKYTPLEHYLRDLPIDQKEVTLSFGHIERILGDTLPPSAYRYQAWWANEKNPHQPEKIAIANAGWTVDSISLKDKWIRLLRK
jgi:hypothetical protein